MEEHPHPSPDGGPYCPPHGPPVQVAVLEVDAPVAAGQPGLGRPAWEKVAQAQDDVRRRRAPRLDAASSPAADGDGGPEGVAAGEPPQHLGGGGAEGAVPRDVLGEGRR